MSELVQYHNELIELRDKIFSLTEQFNSSSYTYYFLCELADRKEPLTGIPKPMAIAIHDIYKRFIEPTNILSEVVTDYAVSLKALKTAVDAANVILDKLIEAVSSESGSDEATEKEILDVIQENAKHEKCE